jgi:hypothetical protein
LQILWSNEATLKLLHHVSVYWDMRNPHLTMEAELYQPGACACGGFFFFIWHSWPMLLFEGAVAGKSDVEVLQNCVVFSPQKCTVTISVILLSAKLGFILK